MLSAEELSLYRLRDALNYQGDSYGSLLKEGIALL